MKQKILPLALAAALICTAGACTPHSTTGGADLPSSTPQSTASAAADSAAPSSAPASSAAPSAPAEEEAPQPVSSGGGDDAAGETPPAPAAARVYLDDLMLKNDVYLDEILFLSENDRVALVPLQREYPVGTATVQAEFINCSDEPFGYGPNSGDFSLEKLVGDVWVRVPAAGDSAMIPSIGASVDPQGRRVKDYDLSEYRPDWLTAGRYRILEGQPGSAYAPRFKCYFRLYDDGSPAPVQNLDEIFQDAASRGDTVYSLPAGGQVALVPEQRSVASADGYLAFSYVNNADTSFTFDWNGSYLRLQRLTDGQWVTVSETAPQPDNSLPTTVGPHSSCRRSLHTYDLGIQPGEYRILDGENLNRTDGVQPVQFTFSFSLTEN